MVSFHFAKVGFYVIYDYSDNKRVNSFHLGTALSRGPPNFGWLPLQYVAFNQSAFR